MRAFVFPGQGVQKIGMGGSLFDEFADTVEQINAILGYSIKTLCLADPDQRLDLTEYAQPAIYVVNALHYMQLQRDANVKADFLAGFSLGEYNALWAAGALDFYAGLRMVQTRGRLMGQAEGGAMAAVVGLTEPALRDALKRHRALDISLANHNTHQQFVISGDKAEIIRLAPLISETPGVQLFSMLKTSGAFHSPHMAQARAAFDASIVGQSWSEPSIPVISNVTALPYAHANIADLLARQITSPVLWTDTIRYLLDQGVDVFTEVGASGALTRMIEQIRRAPSRTAPSSISPLLRSIQAQCAAQPDKTLLVYVDDDSAECVNGATLTRKLAAAGCALMQRVHAHERVILLFPQGFHYGLGLLSCWYANAVAVPVAITDPAQLAHKLDLLRSLVSESGARCILTDRSFKHALAEHAQSWGCELLDIEEWVGEDWVDDASAPGTATPRPAAPEDLALLLYTSGSTSQPKGVMLDHAAIDRSAHSPLWGMNEHSRVVSWLPQFHAFGICLGLLAPLARGASSVVLRPDQFIADPVRWFERMTRHEATHTGAPNFAFDYCRSQIDQDRVAGLSLGSLESLVCGGDMIDKGAYERFAAHFSAAGLRADVLRPNYGLSEAGPITLQTPGQPARALTLERRALQRGEVKPAASGKVLMGCGQWHASTRIVIVDPDTRLMCPADKVGEIWVKSSVVARGYFNDPEQTAATFDGMLADTGEAGFLRTGDLGFLSDEQLYVVGREKDVIAVNGKKHHCADIEATIRSRVPACQLACAVFATDQIVSDDASIVVVQEMAPCHDVSGYADIAGAIVACVSEAHQIHIDDVLFIAQGHMPVTGSRKIRRRACRQQYQSETLTIVWRQRAVRHAATNASSHPPADEDDLAHWMSRLQVEVFEHELGADASPLQAGVTFSRLGLDSIRYIRLARRIEAVFRIPFKPSLLFEQNTREALARYLMKQNESAQDVVYPRWRAYRDETVMRLLHACMREEASIDRTLTVLKEQA